MSNPAETLCCPPMAQRRVEPATASVLAPAFKALAELLTPDA